MAVQTYVAAYSTDDVTYTSLTNLQNIGINFGRQSQLDQIRATTATFSLRYPNGYATPITELVAGTFVRFRNETGSPYVIFFGKITNVSVRYGMPFVNNVGNADFVDITCEGQFADIGRMQGENYVMAADDIIDQINNANNETGLLCGFLPVSATTQMGSTTVSGTWGDWFAKTALTLNARLRDGGSTAGSTMVSPFQSTVSSVNFSDVANDATNQVYQTIDFGSLADNFYTQITVDPENFAAQTVTKVGATAPLRTYQVNTFNASTAQATDYANYLLNNYDTANFAIQSFSCAAAAQSSFQLDKIGASNYLPNAVGTQVSVTFRGTTFVCIIEGVTMSATPNEAIFTYYVSGADLNAYLILDNATFGKLDENKLGY